MFEMAKDVTISKQSKRKTAYTSLHSKEATKIATQSNRSSDQEQHPTYAKDDLINQHQIARSHILNSLRPTTESTKRNLKTADGQSRAKYQTEGNTGTWQDDRAESPRM